MKMKSIASRPFKYGGSLIQPHAEFSVNSARDVKLLSIMRRAAVVAEPIAIAPAASAAPAKRAYKRRDMVAESAITSAVVVTDKPEQIEDAPDAEAGE